jgi:hypothetical protein
MLRKIIMTSLLIIGYGPIAMSGAFINGSWVASKCGDEPLPPVIEQSNIEAYNNSIKIINEWQAKASSYNTCVINEANFDNALIAKVAMEEQNRFRSVIDKIKVDTDAAKAKLEAKE